MDPKRPQKQTHRLFHLQQSTQLDTAPPPYTSSECIESSDEADEIDDADDEIDPPFKLSINNASHIQGNNNLIPTSPSPLVDATRFGTLLLAAVNQINNRAASEATVVAGGGKAARRRGLKVDLTINCGITVIGDRNVVGNIGIRPKAPAQALAGPSAPMSSSVVAGAKRKAEDEKVDGATLAKRADNGNGWAY